MAGNLDVNYSSSDDSDDEMLQEGTAGTAVPAAAADAAMVQRVQAPVNVPAPPPSAMSQSELRPSISSDPFEPIPLSIMRERQQAKEAAQASAPPQQQALQHPAVGIGTSSKVSNASSIVTAQISNTSTSELELDNKAKLERDAKARKERFLMFARVLMMYLEQKDPEMHARARAVIRECTDKNKNKERGYECVTASMQKRLKDMVGDIYWGRVEVHLHQFLKQKKEKVDAQKRKERFLMFFRVLMKYLEQKDPDMHARARAVIRECADKNKNKERGYESVTASMQKRLKDMVGDIYWGRAEVYLNQFLKQKEKVDAQKKQDASSSQL